MSLPTPLLDQLLPFHLITTRDRVIESVGPAIARSVPGLVGQTLDACMGVDQPLWFALDGSVSLDGCLGRGLQLTMNGNGLRLRGQLLRLDQSYLFAVTAALSEPGQLTQWGLTVRDFAPEDAGPDLLILHQVRTLAEQDLQASVTALEAALDANDQLRSTEADLAADLRVAADIRLRVDRAGIIVDISSLLAEVGEAVAGSAIDTSIPELAPVIEQARQGDGKRTHRQVVEFTTGTKTTWLDTRVALLADGVALVVGRDITTQRERELTYRYRATHDPLTGLANRRLFWERVEAALKFDRGESVAVLAIDLDGFKGVNDTYGHAAGDDVLRSSAERIRSLVRSSDTVARLGGDEFAILLEGIGSAAQVQELARRVETHLKRPITADGCLVAISGTIGVAMGDRQATVDSLIRDADLAMYDARRVNGDPIGWFAPHMREGTDTRQAMMADLAEAIESRSIEVHYQPVVGLPSGTVDGFEALARWHHPIHGWIPPDVFIPLAERSRRIADLDHLVLTQAIDQLGTWTRSGWPVQMAANLSPLSLQPALAADISTLLTKAQIRKGRFGVEITETTLLSDMALAQAVIGDLVDRGIFVALDDFGTGFSSLTHLHLLPITGVKIDRSFVNGVVDDEKARRLVAATLGMAHATDATVIAEGVESREQVDVLAALGCNMGQGYYFSRPMNAELATEYLAKTPMTKTAETQESLRTALDGISSL